MTRVVLVGFMAAGKSTVGRETARRLGWPFVDLDLEIEARAGRSVAAIFADEGEAFFRELEARVGAELLGRERVVLATGGGWGAVPGRLDALAPDTLSVWLWVDPATAVARAGADGDTRPLLRGAGAMEAARALSRERNPLYARARLHLDGAGASPDTLASAIVDVVRPPGAPS